MAKQGDIGRVWDFIVNTQVWKSIVRHGYPDTPRNRSLAVMANVFLHLHPIRLRKSGLRVRYTWCMGGLTFFLFLVETITGLLLMFYYRPTAEYAYHDIVYLRADVALGTMREIQMLSLPVTGIATIALWPADLAATPPSAWAGFAYVSAFSMVDGYLYWYRGLALGGAARVGQLQLLQTFAGLGLASLLLGEAVNWSTWAVAGGVALSVFAARRTA
jgi:hypothetical protein